MDKFFQHNTFVIDEEIAAFKLSNTYRVYNDKGEDIGAIQEHKNFLHFMLGIFLPDKMMPFELHVLNEDGKCIAQLKRDITFFTSIVRVFDANNRFLAAVKQKFTLMKSHFSILNYKGQIIATIKGDWKAWKFIITDKTEQPIGSVNKQWNGIAKELFTTADKYIVNINPQVTDEKTRMSIASVAAAIDMILKEG
ncbi:MAG: hypothetical protein IJP75_06775 [Bacteroidaceae bacterium]|nr:hypothetical protein [Bacteroidaceae bacterium]